MIILRYINESPDARRASVGIGRRPVVTPGPMPLPKWHSIELTHHARVASDRSSDVRAPDDHADHLVLAARAPS